MRAHVNRQLIREVEREFNRIYPFLRIDFQKNGGGKADDPGYLGADEQALQLKAKDLLKNEIKIADGMKVSELETALQSAFAYPVQIFRKSGNFWIETRMTRSWTLKQQNDHGGEIL